MSRIENSKFTGLETPESSLDRWLKETLPRSYREQAQTLNRTGLLEILPETGEMGVLGIDGKEYPIPTPETIEAEIKKNQEKYETKINQGFTQILLVPFASPLDRLIDTLGQRILSHHREGKLLATKINPNEPDTKLEVDTNQPVWVWDTWRNSDVSGQCAYYPQSFDPSHHQGRTKQEILNTQTQNQSPFPGWRVLLVEPNMNIPREGKGKTIGGRPQLEANKTPAEYLKLLQTHPQYAQEQGTTLEDWLTLFITHLEKTNEVIDDYQGRGSIAYLMGSFNPASGILA